MNDNVATAPVCDLRQHTPEQVSFETRILQAYTEDNTFVRLYNEGMEKSGMAWTDNFPKRCRFYSLQQVVNTVIRNQDLNGDFAECGCWKGHSTYIISKLLQPNRTTQLFHVFDSFEGGLSDKTAPDITEQSRLTEEATRQEKLHFASTEDELRNAIGEFEFVRVYKGWIPERFHEIEDRHFSFVHIDVDLYQPSLDSLEFFFSRLDHGGASVVDDYGYTNFPGAKKAVDEFLNKNSVQFFYEMPLGGCFLIK